MAYRTPNRNPLGPRVRDIPDGLAQIADASRLWTEARNATARATVAEANALANLQALITSSGSCTDACTHIADGPGPFTKTMRKTMQLAFVLSEEPRLDYQRAADILWGPGLAFGEAKNRVSTALATLRKLGIVTTRGSNVHEIDRDKLAEISGLQVPPRKARS